LARQGLDTYAEKIPGITKTNRRNRKWRNRRFTNNSEYISGIPVPDKLEQPTYLVLGRRFFQHAHGSGHSLACSQLGESQGKQNREGVAEATDDEIKNKLDEKTRLKLPPEVLEYLETRLMKKFTWVEICDGKLFCQVNLTTAGVAKLKTSYYVPVEHWFDPSSSLTRIRYDFWKFLEN